MGGGQTAWSIQLVCPVLSREGYGATQYDRRGSGRCHGQSSNRTAGKAPCPARAVGFVLSSGFGGVQVDRRDVRAWGVGSGAGGELGWTVWM